MAEDGNYMVQSCIVGKECTEEDLSAKLAASPFDVIVLILSAAVADGDAVRGFLMSASATNQKFGAKTKQAEGVSESVKNLVAEKAIYKLETRVFLIVHRAKVKGCVYSPWKSNTAVAGKLEFGVVEVFLETKHQRLPKFKLGIVDIQCEMNRDVVRALAGMCVCGRVAMVTGWFGKGNWEQVANFAAVAGATWKTPLYQVVHCGEQTLVHPSYIIIFGRFRNVSWPTITPVFDLGFFGCDLVSEMEPADDVPTWSLNRKGNIFVQGLGNVKMKVPDRDRMPSHCFQTSVWLGASIPGRGSLKRQIGEKGQGKVKGPGRQRVS